ncbi:FxsA family protein [Kordiimonas gwangyangensis]|uniref:FxsA family protein n=1 Tax=Kordiimonas gwangyangensis TaxID=288022 RepID=UPI00046F8155|nr:FxsA family protein [Kordiimonas gwangyangensis]
MPLLILLLILAIPVVELSILIDVGGEIGALQTVLLCLLTAAVGLSIVRAQGLSTLRNLQGQRIGTQIVHAGFLALAGFFLLIPGFMTDFLGALLLIPPLRLWLGRGITRWMMTNRSDTIRRNNIIIEGEFWSDGERVQDVEVLPPEKADTDRHNTDRPKN